MVHREESDTEGSAVLENDGFMDTGQIAMNSFFRWTRRDCCTLVTAVPMRAFLQAGPIARAGVRRRVLILDDHDFFAACLRTLLEHESDLVVCDIMTNSIELRERIERLRPDLLVIDLSLGAESGLDVGQRLRSLGILTPILFVSSMSSPVQEQLAEISRSAFIAKSRTPAEFLAALRAILAQNESAEEAVAELSLSRAAAGI